MKATVLAIWVAAGLWGQPVAHRGEPVGLRRLNDAILTLQEAVRGGSDEDADRAKAGELLKARAAELRAVMARDAAEAASFAFSEGAARELVELFPEARDLVESHGVWLGTVQRVVFDDLASGKHRQSIRLKTESGELELYFAGDEPEGLATGSVVEAAGVRLGRMAAVTGARIASAASEAGNCPLTGPQNTVVLLVTWDGAAVPPAVTPQSVAEIFFGTSGRSLDGFWREASYNQTSASGNVYGWYTLDAPYTCSQTQEMRDAAMSKAAADGVTFPNNTRVFIIYPAVAGCTAGFAQVGCSTMSTPAGTFTGSWAHIEADYMTGDQGVQLAAHEGGHTLGLQHAGTLSYAGETLGPVGTPGIVNEMGDYWSAMAQSLGQYPAQQKAEVLGWMKSGLNYQVVQSSGTWSLQPIEMSPAGLQALKIQRGTGGTGWLWVEYRQPVGNYDTTLMTQPFGGALVHYEDATTGTFTRLLDFSPDYSWNTWWYPALPAGSSWTDPYTNLSISVVSATPGALTLNVTYTAAPCTRANPAVSASPANPSTNAGKTVPYTVTVMNNDSPGCAAGSFSLSSSQPSGWSTNFSTGTLTLNPGQSGTVTMNKGVPAGTAAGTYLVNAGASQGTAAGVGTANCTVMAAPLTASLSVPKTSYPARSTVTMTAALSGSGAAGANVTFTLTKPKGGSATKKVRADPAGKASWAYTLGAKDPPGSYSAAAEASAGAATAASNTVTFTVQ